MVLPPYLRGEHFFRPKDCLYADLCPSAFLQQSDQKHTANKTKKADARIRIMPIAFF
jgi:hypothetical protein